MSFEGTRVGVTGGAGFIGSHLVDHLIQQRPASVVVVDDFSSGSRQHAAEWPAVVTTVEGDVRMASGVEPMADCDVVFHLAVRNVRASIGRPAENFEVNANGTLAVLEAMRHGRQGKFVYLSSSEVYGIPASGEYREDRVPSPTTAYGAGKLAGEHIALAYRHTYGMDTRVIRPFNNYGPRSHFEGDSGEVIPKFILRALAGRPLIIHGDGSQSRDFMYVRDTVSWLLRLAEVDALSGETVNIGTGVDVTIDQLAQVVLEVTGSDSPIERGPERPGDLPRLRADTAKIRQFVDFDLDTSFSEGLGATVEYFRQFDPEELLRAEQERTWA